MSDQSPVERPRSEPEILPPGQGERWHRRTSEPWGTRIYVTRLGPLSSLFLIGAVGLVAALLLVVLLGAFLLWIPIIGLGIAVAIVTGLLRGYFRRPG
jgi:hypothetical protein